MSNLSSLQGKIAVITGSTQGLGEATARLFKARGISGLIINGRNQERGEKVAQSLTGDGCKAVFVQADMENVAALRLPLRRQHRLRLWLLLHGRGRPHGHLRARRRPVARVTLPPQLPLFLGVVPKDRKRKVPVRANLRRIRRQVLFQELDPVFQ